MSNYNSTLQSNNTDLQAILNTINELPEATEQATPVISMNSANGLITATAGTKTSTHQLAFQLAQTITPTTTSQIAVSSGYYTGGNITVAGDANLVAGNIKSGVSIFGISGNYEGSGISGSGDSNIEDDFITGTLSSFANDTITTIGSYAFVFYTSLTTVSFPAATTIGGHAFDLCRNLSTVYLPKVATIGEYAFYGTSLRTGSFKAATSIGRNAFYQCISLSIVSFPKLATIGTSAFCYCSNLTTVRLPAATTIGNYAFRGNYNLKSLYLTGTSVCTLSDSTAFISTPIGGYSTSAGTYGSIYVPTSLLTSYQAATNWTYFSSRFVGI